MYCVTHCSHLILDLCLRQAALHFPSPPGLDLWIVAECFLKPHTFLTHLKPSAKNLGFGPSARLRRRCWDYSLVRSPLRGRSLMGHDSVRRDVVFWSLNATHTHTHTHTYVHEVIHLNTLRCCFFPRWFNLLFANVPKWLKEEHQCKEPTVRSCHVLLLPKHPVMAPTVSSSNTSGVNMELSFPHKGQKILDQEGPPNTTPASTFTSIFSRVYNGPLQQNPREYESSQCHVCVWSSACAVWIPLVRSTRPQAENMILFSQYSVFQKIKW